VPSVRSIARFTRLPGGSVVCGSGLAVGCKAVATLFRRRDKADQGEAMTCRLRSADPRLGLALVEAKGLPSGTSYAEDRQSIPLRPPDTGSEA
jgi:hypothetical protein